MAGHYVSSTIACIVALSCAITQSTASWTSDIYSIARTAFWYTVDFVESVVVKAAKAFEQPSQAPRIVGLVAARSFVQRIVKRDRPVLTASWRLGPSI
jgi:hypothetical protein